MCFVVCLRISWSCRGGGRRRRMWWWTRSASPLSSSWGEGAKRCCSWLKTTGSHLVIRNQRKVQSLMPSLSHQKRLTTFFFLVILPFALYTVRTFDDEWTNRISSNEHLKQEPKWKAHVTLKEERPKNSKLKAKLLFQKSLVKPDKK